MKHITSTELNLLVFRYLQDSGFTHTTFIFGHEAGMVNCPIDGSLVPLGALIKLVQRGLQHLERETNLRNADNDIDEDFSFLQPLDFITKNAGELQQMVVEKRKEKLIVGENKVSWGQKGYRSRFKIKIKRNRQKEDQKHEERMDQDKLKEKMHDSTEGRQIVDPHDLPGPDVMILIGHSKKVSCCAWSPTGCILASGSGDSTARIWTIVDMTKGSRFSKGPTNVIVLNHGRGKRHATDVTALDWSGDGTLLATGSFDGLTRIWSSNGELMHTLGKHKGAISSVKWNKGGTYILTGSYDNTALLWDVKAQKLKQHFGFYSGSVLDVDWRDNHSFATSSSDHKIYVGKVGKAHPINTFSGHEGEVLCVRWDPSGTLLASCSDDKTAKIWSTKQEKYVHDFREHLKEIYTIRWSPTGPGTGNPNLRKILASASLDSTVKIWDVDEGKLICSLNAHRAGVYGVAFSPNGEYLATGSLDRSLYIWSARETKIIKTYTAHGIIFQVCWNKEGDKVAACCEDGKVCVLDIRK